MRILSSVACFGFAAFLSFAPLLPAQLATLTPNPLILTPLAPSTLTVTLPAPAGSGGRLVSLSSGDSNVVTVPAAVTVAEGALAADIAVTPINVGNTNVTALVSGLPPVSAAVNVVAPTIGVTLDAAALGITRTVGGTVTISAPASAAGTGISLNTNPSGIADAAPASFAIPAGATSARFTVTGLAEGTTVVVASSPGYSSGSANLTVGRLGQIVLPVNVVLGANQSAPFPISLATPAPVGGVTITLASSDPAKVAVTSTVTILAGFQTPAMQAQVFGFNFGTATITASAPGFSGDSELVAVVGALSFSPANVTFGTNSTQAISLLLSSPAPAGLIVNLSSDNPSVAVVPAMVMFAANATGVVVPITNVGAGLATIHASALPNLADTTAVVSVANFGALGLPASVTLAPGQTAAFPVSLPTPASGGGATITLTNSDPTKAALSSLTVSIPPGATVPMAQPQVTGLDFGSSTVVASAPGFTGASSAVQVIGTLSFAPPSLTITAPLTQSATLNLSAPAPAKGLAVTLSSSNPAAVMVPPSVSFAPGAIVASVSLTSVAPGSATVSAVAAVPNVAPAAANVTVLSAGAISLPAGVTLVPNQPVSYPVTLTSAAPAGGVTVTLSSGDPSIVTITPATVSIAAGATMPDKQPQVTGVNFGSATITASAPGFTQASQTVQVVGALSFTPGNVTITGTGTQNLTLILSVAAPAGLTVNLASSAPGIATVPPSVTFPANSMAVTVTVTGVMPGMATITATAASSAVAGATATATVVNPAPLGAIILPANFSVAPNHPTPFPVTLSTAAPAGGVTVTLTSSDPSKLTIAATAFVPAGATMPASPPLITGVNFGTATISASAPNYTSAAQSVQVTATLSFSPTTATIAGTATQNLTLNLSAPAPAAGLTVTLTGNPSVFATPASVSFAANATSVTVPVTGVAPGTATITAHGANLPANLADASANITVIPAPDISLPSGLSLALGDQIRIQVTLAKAAPKDGVFVMLSSGDTKKLTIFPLNIFIPEGSTTSSQPQLTAVAVGTATISAIASGLTGDTELVSVGSSLGLSPSSLTIAGLGATQNLTLTLSPPAPAGGLTVNLSSSNPGVATVPATVMFAPGASVVSVPITGVSAGAAVIHANALPTFGDTTASVTVTAAGGPGIGLPPSLTLRVGDTVVFPVTLAVSAPDGGVFVMLTSGDPSKVSVSTGIVFIPSGESMSTKARITAVSAGTVSVSASATGYAPGTSTVQSNP